MGRGGMASGRLGVGWGRVGGVRVSKGRVV